MTGTAALMAWWLQSVVAVHDVQRLHVPSKALEFGEQHARREFVYDALGRVDEDGLVGMFELWDVERVASKGPYSHSLVAEVFNHSRPYRVRDHVLITWP
jgi:hypothetical protein